MEIGTTRDFWKAYQVGQMSADHTSYEVFEEVIGPLIDEAKRLQALERAAWNYERADWNNIKEIDRAYKHLKKLMNIGRSREDQENLGA